jgi:arylsulfatase A-like enzyme
MTPALPSFLFLLVDDIGWSDFSYNNGTAYTPNIDAWANRSGSILLQDFHSGGTVCSPTRATVLTGRNHFRDCVDFVYGCSDMKQCIPDFQFAPSNTFTVGDVVRRAHPIEYGDGGAYFAGKWHLGSFFNDSAAYGGTYASPMNHGFSKMNATIEVAPTRTANCQCRAEWLDQCEFGHYHQPNHCFPDGQCCFNYWWDDPLSPHGVTNLTVPTPPDDSLYLADAFTRYLSDRSQPPLYNNNNNHHHHKPFLAQISFHNCHIPFIGSEPIKASCARGETCRLPAMGELPYNEEELDYYACLIELDNAVGTILSSLEQYGYYDNTMIWFASDNGPEMNCPPNGICQNADIDPQRPRENPGSAGPLRGRKRDIYEGGHRVSGIVSFPAQINTEGSGGSITSWETVVTMDFLPTVVDVLLGIDGMTTLRPPEQHDWPIDGRSILPLLQNPYTFRWNETVDGPREIGWGFHNATLNIVNGWGYRFGPWKYVEGSVSCTDEDCKKPQLFNLEWDVGERHELSMDYPDILVDIQQRFQRWHESVVHSRIYESKCRKTDLDLPPSLIHSRLTDTALEA